MCTFCSLYTNVWEHCLVFCVVLFPDIKVEVTPIPIGVTYGYVPTCDGDKEWEKKMSSIPFIDTERITKAKSILYSFLPDCNSLCPILFTGNVIDIITRQTRGEREETIIHPRNIGRGEGDERIERESLLPKFCCMVLGVVCANKLLAAARCVLTEKQEEEERGGGSLASQSLGAPSLPPPPPHSCLYQDRPRRGCI